MNKELTPLEAFGNIIKSTRLTYLFTYYEKELDIIETALKRLEIIDNSVQCDMEYYEKRNRALEIIKEKVDDMESLRNCIYMDFPLEHYNEIVGWSHGEFLTQEEYDLLKEVLL